MSQAKMLRPTWAEVNLSKFESNVRLLRERAGVKIMLVLKADAYGHGATPLGRLAEEKQIAEMFGVASIEEGIELRAAGLKTPILVLGSTFPFEGFEVALRHDLAVTVASLRAADAVIAAAEKTGKKAVCHVKQDTGMGRIGARRPGAVKILERLSASKHIILEGFYTHLSMADNAPAREQQIKYFDEAIAQAAAKNIFPPLKHVCATHGVLTAKKHYDMARIGIGAYGGVIGYGLEGILTLKSKIVYIKDVRANVGISYNAEFITPKPMRLATIPIGYGDGYLRAASGKAEVLINGERRPLLGNITMDMVMADITGMENVDTGTEVVLLGQQGQEEITTTEAALKAGTISYEVTTLITKRVPRIYV